MKRGRKSKFDVSIPLSNSKWIAGIYCRLSTEDIEKIDNQSQSIINQKNAIDYWLNDHNGEMDISVFDYYIDDGFSGTTFDRPEVQRLFNDINLNKVNMIIIKDLSRIGRNYIEVGTLLEKVVVNKSVRLVSINDNIDSFKNPDSIDNIIVPFKNLINQSYCKDLSDKIKIVLRNKRKNGEYIYKRPPYGYKKDPNNKYHLIIDKNVSDIVKLIFDLAIKGYGARRITNYLNDNNIENSVLYLNREYNLNIPQVNTKNPNKWSIPTVQRILRNRFYVGDTVIKKYETNYLNHKQKEQLDIIEVVENTHEPIIDREIFNQIQNHKKKIDPNIRHISNTPLSGHIRCYDCKCNMRRNYNCYYCSQYADYKTCTKHRVMFNEVDQIVLRTIMNEINSFANIDEVIKKIKNDRTTKDKLKKINSINNKLNSIKNKKISLYNSMKQNDISLLDFKELNNKYNEEEKLLENQKKETENYIDLNFNYWYKRIKKFLNMKELTKQLVDNFIDEVLVKEDGSLIIKFKYVNHLNELKAVLGGIENG